MPTPQPARRRNVIALTVLAACLILSGEAGSPALARQAQVYSQSGATIAVSGYDPVAYFTAGQPVKGSPDITAQHDGATWLFSSTAHRDAFLANPAKYAPQYGGYCAWAVSQGHTASADPLAWKIAGGKLYLNYSQDVAAMWRQDIPGNIAKADANWPKVLEK